MVSSSLVMKKVFFIAKCFLYAHTALATLKQKYRQNGAPSNLSNTSFFQVKIRGVKIYVLINKISRCEMKYFLKLPHAIELPIYANAKALKVKRLIKYLGNKSPFLKYMWDKKQILHFLAIKYMRKLLKSGSNAIKEFCNR